MRKFRFLSLVTGFFVLAVTPSQLYAAPFDGLLGQAYALVLTGSRNDPLYIEEIAALTAGVNALKARNIVTIYFKDKTLDTLEELSAFDYDPYVIRKAAQASYLEQQLQTDDDIFSVVLVGRDGAVQKVWTGVVVKPEEILYTIDNYVPPPPLSSGVPEEKDKMELNSTKLKEMKMQNPVQDATNKGGY